MQYLHERSNMACILKNNYHIKKRKDKEKTKKATNIEIILMVTSHSTISKRPEVLPPTMKSSMPPKPSLHEPKSILSRIRLDSNPERET